jgi:hypothetical protein
LARRATMIRRSRGILDLALDPDLLLGLAQARCGPAGTSWLAPCTARITSSTPTPCDIICAGLRLMSTWRATPPEVCTWPTPETFWKRLTMICSVIVVSSRSVRESEVTASCTTGWALSKSPLRISGSLASRGKSGRMSAILSRTSCTAPPHLGVEAELDVGLAASFPRVRADHLHAVDGVDHLLDRLGDVVLDAFGRGARVVHLDEDERDGDVGHALDPQRVVREEAEHAQEHHHHGGEDGLADAGARDPHGRLPFRFSPSRRAWSRPPRS